MTFYYIFYTWSIYLSGLIVSPSPSWCMQLFIVVPLLLAHPVPREIILDFTGAVLLLLELMGGFKNMRVVFSLSAVSEKSCVAGSKFKPASQTKHHMRGRHPNPSATATTYGNL